MRWSAAARSISLLLLLATAVQVSSSPGRSAADREKGGRLRDASGFASHWRDCHFAAPPSRPLAGFSIGMERECQQNDSLADG